ncbi:AI-2E family transporter [Humitalea sp. 24SJ18S-53]|uniref:AI-2E family transporter n=1 Tax=Humitalea sp. 24SJ18S-53 TaxID=3422307 RepID=UPI003D67EC2D
MLMAFGIVGALYLGRDILAPLALALLLTIAALPVADALERRGVPRVPSVLLVLLLVVGLMGGMLALVVGQALALATELPRYEQVLREKLLVIGQESGPITELVRLGGRLSAALAPAEAPATTIAVMASPETPLAAIMGLLHVVLAPAATVAITLLLMAFLLIQRENMRDRILRLAGVHEMHRTTQAMGDATQRVGRFLLTQVVMNGAFGVSMGLGLWLLGVPNAPLWGVLGFLLRFVPFLGAPISVLFPLLMAFATTEGWTTVILVIVLFAIVDVAISYVLEPWLIGASTGITPLALVLSSAFWAVMWGPIGLILAPAITACLVILGRHVQQLAFLDILLGDTEALSQPARFYQRILAGDARGAHLLIEEATLREGASGAIRQMVLPAIAQISADRPSGSFGPAMALRSARGLLSVLDVMTEEAPWAGVVLLPVAGGLDRAAAAAVAVVMAEDGQGASIGPTQGTARIAVIVTTGVTSAARLRRAMATARETGAEILAFVIGDAAEAALADAEPVLPQFHTLALLLSEIDTRLGTGGEVVEKRGVAL